MFCMRPDFFIFLLSFIIVPQLKIIYDNVMYLMLWTLFYMESWECPANALSQWLSTTSHNNASLKVATGWFSDQGNCELLAINQWRQYRGRRLDTFIHLLSEITGTPDLGELRWAFFSFLFVRFVMSYQIYPFRNSQHQKQKKKTWTTSVSGYKLGSPN